MTLSRTPLGRGEPLQRKTPLSSGRPLARSRTPQTRVRAPKTRVRSTGPTEETRALVRARDRGLCVRCGRPARDLDHRRGRGAGGTHGDLSERINGAAWLITLCGTGGSSGCHMEKEQNRHDAERDGYRLPRNGVPVDAERVPVRTRAGWALFFNDGTRVPCPAPPNDDAREVWGS